jgi:hypothetical protein
MLNFATLTVECGPAGIDRCRAALISYLGMLVSRGYLARRGTALHEHGDGRFALTGIACAPDALHDAEADSQCRLILDDLARDGSIRMGASYVLASTTMDECYCEVDRPERIRLSCDVLTGLSPLRGLDGGIIARYKLALPEDLANELWAWDVEYEHVYHLWLTSGAYETWAEHELQDPAGALNRRGTVLAEALSRSCGIEVTYNPGQ